MANAVKKISLKWHVAFLRGIGANWLVCLAWWQALSSKVDLVDAHMRLAWGLCVCIRVCGAKDSMFGSACVVYVLKHAQRQSERWH